MSAVLATRPIPAMVRVLPGRWVEAARTALLGKTAVGKSLACAALAALFLWVLRWRARVGRARVSAGRQTSTPLTKEVTTFAGCPPVLTITTVDLSGDDAVNEPDHDTTTPQVELPQTNGPVARGLAALRQTQRTETDRLPDLGVLTTSATGTTADSASDDDGGPDHELPTPSTAKLLARLQAPRRFKASTWQPRTDARNSSLVALATNEAQTVVEGQAQQQRAAAAAAKQRREEKREASEAGLHRSGSQTLQPNCEVYSSSSGSWVKGTFTPVDEAIMPNTVRVQYVSAKGSTMQKLLKVESPHLRKVKPIQGLDLNVPEAEQKDSATELPQARLCLSQVTNEQANVALTTSAVRKTKCDRRGPRNGGGGYKKRYKATAV